MNKFYLFSYGTLMDLELQKILFGQEIKMFDGVLENYKVFADIDGYYYVKKALGGIIQGKILELSQEEMWIADQWEEIPRYIRTKSKVKLKDGSYKEVFFYEKSNVKAKYDVDSNKLSNFSIEEVLVFAKNLKKQLNRLSLTASDLYIQAPCCVKSIININNFCDDLLFVKNTQLIYKNENNNTLSLNIQRIFLDRVYLIMGEEIQICDVYLSVNKGTKCGVLTFMMPLVTVDSMKLLNCINTKNIKIRIDNTLKEITIENWLLGFYIKLNGIAKGIIYAPYNYPEINVSQNITIEGSKDFEDNFTDRIKKQITKLLQYEVKYL